MYNRRRSSLMPDPPSLLRKYFILIEWNYIYDQDYDEDNSSNYSVVYMKFKFIENAE